MEQQKREGWIENWKETLDWAWYEIFMLSEQKQPLTINDVHDILVKKIEITSSRSRGKIVKSLVMTQKIAVTPDQHVVILEKPGMNMPNKEAKIEDSKIKITMRELNAIKESNKVSINKIILHYIKINGEIIVQTLDREIRELPKRDQSVKTDKDGNYWLENKFGSEKPLDKFMKEF